MRAAQEIIREPQKCIESFIWNSHTWLRSTYTLDIFQLMMLQSDFLSPSGDLDDGSLNSIQDSGEFQFNKKFQ